MADDNCSVTARINRKLLQLANERAGVETNSALVEIAIANFAVGDGVSDAFARARGRVPDDTELSI